MSQTTYFVENTCDFSFLDASILDDLMRIILVYDKLFHTLFYRQVLSCVKAFYNECESS